ncbi:MAG: Fur family transcriptional regulator [Candidatus Aphodosoma sp.]
MTPHEELHLYIKKHRLRKTYERDEILRMIVETDGHFSAQSLYEMNKESAVHFSLASFYNTIEFLLRASIIVKHPFAGAEQQYELRQRAVSHHHRICTVCGAIKEFSDLKFTKAVFNRKFNTFDTQYQSIYLYGVCSKCQPRKKSDKPKK